MAGVAGPVTAAAVAFVAIITGFSRVFFFLPKERRKRGDKKQQSNNRYFCIIHPCFQKSCCFFLMPIITSHNKRTGLFNARFFLDIRKIFPYYASISKR
jgi:hypothetical protein